MKGTSFLRRLLLLAVFVSSMADKPSLCAQDFTVRADHTTLLDVYVPPHQRPVEVFFPISGMPQRPYLHLAYLSARQGMIGNATDLVIDLQNKTQQVGGDAVIILNSAPRTEVVHAFESTETVDVNTMSGLAIIYPESLQFVPGRYKSWEISRPDSTDRAWQVVATQPFDFKGNSGKLTGQKAWFDWWHKRRIESFVGSRAFRKEDSYGRIRSINNPFQQRRMVFTYEMPGTSSRLKSTKIYQSGMLLETHHFHYTEDKKQVAYIEIAPANRPDQRFLEFTETDSEGRVKGFLYLLKQNGESTQYLRVDYVEYTYEEWEEIVAEILANHLVTPK
ncbi:MAG: hypothetical protein KF852_12545 [Saprospiraceae bacterium]|nr:hypothetical protein [Saprospiraceae bacterium]